MKKKIILFFGAITLSICSVKSQVGINTEKPNPLNVSNIALDINGKVIIRDLESTNIDISNYQYIAVNDHGVLFSKKGMNSELLFYQTTTGIKYSDPTIIKQFNNSPNFLFTVPWDATDEIINTNIITYNKSENSFVFIKSGYYDINAIVNFGLEITNSPTITSRVAVNVTIQYAKVKSLTWNSLATNRSIFTAGELTAGDYTAMTIITPPALFQFEPGDRIRMVINKAFGDNIDAFEISKPTGSIISKQIKILRL